MEGQGHVEHQPGGEALAKVLARLQGPLLVAQGAHVLVGEGDFSQPKRTMSQVMYTQSMKMGMAPSDP